MMMDPREKTRLQASVLVALFDRLTDANRTIDPAPFAKRIARALADKSPSPLVHGYQVEDDLADCLGCCIGDFGPLFEQLGFPPAMFYGHPGVRGGGAMGFTGWRLPEYAALCFQLARFGIPADPMPLHRAVAPAIPKRGFLTAAELHVLWGPRELRGSNISVTGLGGEIAFSAGKTAGGYRLELWVTERSSNLRSRGPTWRSERHRGPWGVAA